MIQPTTSLSRRIALVVIASGVVIFMGGMFHAFGAWSLQLVIPGLVVLVAGLCGLVFSLRSTPLTFPPVCTIALIVAGVVLQVRQQAELPGPPLSFAWLGWVFAPYAVCVLASVVPATRIPSIGGTAAALLFDLWVHFNVVENSGGPAIAPVFMFGPLWSGLVFVPLGMLATWFAVRSIFRLRSKS